MMPDMSEDICDGAIANYCPCAICDPMESSIFWRLRKPWSKLSRLVGR